MQLLQVTPFHDMQTFLAPVKGAVLDMHHPSLIFSSFAILPSSYHRLPPVPLTKAQLLPCPSVVPDWRPLVFSTAKNSIAPRNQRNFIRHSPLFRDQAVLECAVNASLRSGISKFHLSLPQLIDQESLKFHSSRPQLRPQPALSRPGK